jgi:hypothetical protein
METNRLQWTHFKYNCTGKFSNSKEYKLVYPQAVLVSADVAAKTAITKDRLIKKYGIEEGALRWDQYKAKQADSNSYEYKRKKYGWTIEQYTEYNSSRAQTLEKMIARHGENLGTSNWLEYCERQAYTNSKIYFIEKYGVEEGTARFLKLNINFSIVSRDDIPNIDDVDSQYFINATPIEIKSSKNKIIDLRPHTEDGKLVSKLQATQQFKIYTGIDYENS